MPILTVLDFPSRPIAWEVFQIPEWDVLGLGLLAEMCECLFNAWEAAVTAADATSRVTHLDNGMWRLPCEQFGDQTCHIFVFHLEDKTVFREGSMGIDEAEVEIEGNGMTSRYVEQSLEIL